MTFYLFLGDRHGTNSNLRCHTLGLAVKTAQSVSFITLLLMLEAI